MTFITRFFSFFKESFKIVKKYKTLAIIIVLFYSFFFLSGVVVGLFFDILDEETQAMFRITFKDSLENVASSVYKFGNFWPIGIFINNLAASVFSLLYGILIIPAFFSLMTNSVIAGLSFGQFINSPAIVGPLELILFIIILSLESFVIIFSSVEGIGLTLSLLFPKKFFKKKIKRSKILKIKLQEISKIYVVFIVLLLIAAAIETLEINYLWLKIDRLGLKLEDFNEECGIVFWKVIPNSPAERAGLRPGVIYNRIDSIFFRNLTEFDSRMNLTFPNQKIVFVSLKGKLSEVILGEWPNKEYDKGFLGIQEITTAYVRKDTCK